MYINLRSSHSSSYAVIPRNFRENDWFILLLISFWGDHHGSSCPVPPRVSSRTTYAYDTLLGGRFLPLEVLDPVRNQERLVPMSWIITPEGPPSGILRAREFDGFDGSVGEG